MFDTKIHLDEEPHNDKAQGVVMIKVNTAKSQLMHYAANSTLSQVFNVAKYSPNMDTSSLEVRNNSEKRRFEIEIEGKYAIAEYILAGDRIVFTHTEVPPAFEGQGLANKLAHTALEYAREHHLHVMPLCPYIASYMKHHPEYQDLLAAGFHV